MCSAKEPNRRRSTAPILKAGSKESVAEVTSGRYPAFIVVNHAPETTTNRWTASAPEGTLGGCEGVAVRVRLRDVADHAGVSVKTVSNVVNGYVHVAPQTRAHVQAVLDEMGYRPNLAARNLRAGRTGVIALAFPELDNPYFAELTGFVVQAAEERGWTVLVDQTDGLRERELLVAGGFRHHLIDGLILSPVALGAADLAQRGPQDMPLVLLGEKISSGPVDHVAVDNIAAARAATDHLVAQGRTRVALIGDEPGRSESGVARLRRQGWEDALRAAGLPADPRLTADV